MADEGQESGQPPKSQIRSDFFRRNNFKVVYVIIIQRKHKREGRILSLCDGVRIFS